MQCPPGRHVRTKLVCIHKLRSCSRSAKVLRSKHMGFVSTQSSLERSIQSFPSQAALTSLAGSSGSKSRPRSQGERPLPASGQVDRTGVVRDHLHEVPADGLHREHGRVSRQGPWRSTDHFLLQEFEEAQHAIRTYISVEFVTFDSNKPVLNHLVPAKRKLALVFVITVESSFITRKV